MYFNSHRKVEKTNKNVEKVHQLTLGNMNNNGLGIRGRRIASVLSRIGLVSLRNEQGCHNFQFSFVDNDRSTPSPIIGDDLKHLKNW
jgi:hypothetical protein